MTQNILSNFQSPATGYEIILTELNKSQNSRDEKILKVFEILDDLIPNLGVYYKIMRIVRQQLFDAVFSNEFTAARVSDQSTDPKIQRKSYYLLYKDVKDLKEGKLEALKEELREKDELLSRKEIMLNQFISLNENLRQEISNSNAQIEKLKNEFDLKKTEIFHMQRRFNSTEALYKQKIESLENNIEFLNEDLEQRIREIKELTAYKQSYDEIHKMFSPSFSDRTVKSARKPIGLNRKNQVITDILSAKKFEEQLHALINVSTEEYDDFLEKQQEYLLEKYKKTLNPEGSSTLTRFNDTKPFLSLFEKEMLAQQMEAEKINYQKSIADLKNQYELIVQHRKALEEKLTILELDKENTEFIRKQRAKATSATQSKKGSAVQGLEEHLEPIRNGADRDPYSVQDRLYSKFACTMHFSPDSKYWYDFDLVTLCENCGDKTLICPHKLSLESTIIKIPNNTNYLKFSRPKLKINQSLVKRALDSFKKPNTAYQVGENSIVLTNYKTKYPIIPKDDLNRETVSLLSQGNPDIGMPHDFRRIWKDYESKTQYKRIVQRPFTYVLNSF